MLGIASTNFMIVDGSCVIPGKLFGKSEVFV